MKTPILISILLLALLNSQGQSWQYALSVGGSDGGDNYVQNNKPQCVEIDEQGNTYVFGNYGAGTEINDSTLKAFDDTQGSFIVKYNCEGEVDWFKAISNSSHRDDQADYMLRKGNYLYVMGSVHFDNYYHSWFIDTTVIGSLLDYEYIHGNVTFPWIPYRTYTYLIKMDLDGNILDKHFLTTYREPINKGYYTNLWGAFSQKPFTIDNQGNYYFFADFPSDKETTLYCDSFPLISTTAPEFAQHILKFDSDFNFLWSKSIAQGVSDTTNTDGIILYLNDIYCDTQNNIFLVGVVSIRGGTYVDNYTAEIDLGNEQHFTVYNTGNGGLGFLLKMDTSGTVQWTQQARHFQLDSTYVSNSFFESILVNEETGSIYIGGRAGAVTILNPDIGTIFGESDTIFNNFPDFPQNPDGFIAKYDTDGNYHWVSVPKSSGKYISSLAIYQNKLYGTVSWVTELTFGDSVYTSANTTRGFTLCTWDTAGNELSSSSFPCAQWNDPMPYDTRVNNQGAIVITGLNATTMSFGSHEINAEGYKKIFIAKYAPNCTVSVPEIAETSTFKIYPNPAHDYIVIASLVLSEVEGEAKQSQAKTVGIYDLTGKLVKSSSLRSSKQSIQIGDLEKGIYFVQVGTETQKFLVE